MKQMKVKAGFAAPAFLVYTLLLVIPIIMAFGLSFVSWNGIGEMRFVGLRNYMMVFRDKSIGNAVSNTLIITLVQTVVCNVLGLFLAVLLNQTGKRTAIFRTIYFLPNVLSGVAIAFVWKAIFSYNGVLNTILAAVGLDHLVAAYMSTHVSALVCIIVVGIWSSLGYYMMIYISALQSVPQELYEAAIVDGATAWSKFRYITLPLITSGTMVSFLMSIINGLRAYDVVKIMTDGGPGKMTETIVYNIVRYGFSGNMMGYSSAISVVLFFAIALISILIVQAFNKREVS